MFLIMVLTGCSIGQSKTSYEVVEDPLIIQAKAQMALNNFLSHLEMKQYQQATQYFGGSYDYLKELNPNINNTSAHNYLKHFCESNSGICLPFTIKSQKKIDENVFVFQVQYFEDNGQLFINGCGCGGIDQEKKDKFNFSVRKEGEKYYVVDLPPIRK